MSGIPVLGQNPETTNPLLVLARALDEMTNESRKQTLRLAQIADNTSPEKRHAYVMTETIKGWGTYCLACSDQAGDYVYPCKSPIRDLDAPVPPQFFVIGEQPETDL